jgi:uncharacterized RDD family membrane protein YckC
MANIEIKTTQNVVIEYEQASLRDRFFALFIDLCLYYVGYYAVWFTIITLLENALTDWGFRFIMLTNMVGFVFYCLLSEVLMNGRTLGKKALNLKVVRLDGKEPGLGDYLLRSVFLLIDFFFSLGILGGLLIGSTLRGQRLGDLAANTAVIRSKSQVQFRLDDILKIQSLENYELTYPAVKQLNDSDVLLLKNLIGRFQRWRNEAHIKAIAEATDTLCQRLQIEPPAGNKIDFLKTLIRDYIVLTR